VADIPTAFVATDGRGKPVIGVLAECDARQVLAVWERVERAATGAAAGTDTKVETEVVDGGDALLPNETLACMIDANLRRVGWRALRERGVPVRGDARCHAATLCGDRGDPAEAEHTKRLHALGRRGSTDGGDVSWVVPNSGVSTAMGVPSTPAHSRQAVAAGGTGRCPPPRRRWC
jgi:aminobenzoyl-glutamate utilization protein B